MKNIVFLYLLEMKMEMNRQVLEDVIIFYRIKKKKKKKKLAIMVAIFTPLKPSIVLWHETTQKQMRLATGRTHNSKTLMCDGSFGFLPLNHLPRRCKCVQIYLG